jgi:hypothetical protein
MARLSAPLSSQILHHVDTLFLPEDRERAEVLLYERCNGDVPETERCRAAALKCSDGDLSKLEKAVTLAQIDFRDLLMAAGFGEVTAHLKWKPMPASEPAQIDPVSLATGIHENLRPFLSRFTAMNGGAMVKSGKVCVCSQVCPVARKHDSSFA